MIELEPRKDGFPAAGGMAGVAGFLEAAFVWIEVASGTGIELHVPIAHRSARHIGLVALFARHFDVQASQSIASFGMVKVLGCLPTFDVVAFGALVAQLALVGIRVARNAVA